MIKYFGCVKKFRSIVIVSSYAKWHHEVSKENMKQNMKQILFKPYAFEIKYGWRPGSGWI